MRTSLKLALLIALAVTAATAMAQEANIALTPGLKQAAARYTIVQNFHDGMAPVLGSKGWGYIDSTGTEVVPCGTINAKYDLCHDRADYGFYRDNGYVRDYHCGMVAVAKETSGSKNAWDRVLKWGYMDRTGRLVVDYQYDEAADFSEGLAYVSNDQFHGFIDREGNRVIDAAAYYQPDMTLNYSFHNGLAAVGKPNGDDTKWGYIDRQGREAIACTFDVARNFSEGLAATAAFDANDVDNQFPYLYTFIDTLGNHKFSMREGYSCNDFHCGLASFTSDERLFGFIDTTGLQVIAAKYYTDEVAMPMFIADFSEGYTLVGTPQGTGDDSQMVYNLMDAKQQMSSFPVQGNVHQGLALNAQGGKFGFITPQGEQRIPCQFDYTQSCVEGELLSGTCRFSEGLAAVRQGGKWGWVDLQGNTTF